MRAWKHVKWTEAGQIADLLGWEEDLGEKARAMPEEYFAELKQAGRLVDAVSFLSQALPRYETVAWATRMVRELAPTDTVKGAGAEALKAAMLWVQDPSDARRRAAFDAANRMQKNTPERLAALAAYFSGGSIAPVEAPAAPAAKEAAGRLASGAVLLAAIRCSDRDAAMVRALDAGALIAEQGLSAASA